MHFTICSSTWAQFSPVLALTFTAWAVSTRPMTVSICSRTRSGSALGRSVLLRTGNTSRPFSSAR